jgi:hypothetical protein
MHRGLPGFVAELELSKVSDRGGSSTAAATSSSTRESIPIWMQMKCEFESTTMIKEFMISCEWFEWRIKHAVV